MYSVQAAIISQPSPSGSAPGVAKAQDPSHVLDLQRPREVAQYFPQTVAAIESYADEAKQAVEVGLAQIMSLSPEQRTFENTFYALDRLQTYFTSRTQALGVVSLTHTVREVRDLAKEKSDRMKAFAIDNFQNNRAIYQICQLVHTKMSTDGEFCNPQQRSYVEDKMLSFKREGLHLSEGEIGEIKELKKQIAERASSFLKNIDEDQSHLWVTKENLAGLSDEFLKSLEHKDGKYKLTCGLSLWMHVMNYCQTESTRKRLYHLFRERTGEVNIPLLNRLISLRHQLALRLGYKSFAEYDLEDQMAKSVEKVDAFIGSVVEATRGKAQEEKDLLCHELPEGVTLTEEGKIKIWDLFFLSTKYKINHLKIDELKLQEHFAFDQTLNRIFELYTDLFNLTFQPVSNEGLWHDTAKMFAVHDRTNHRLIGHIVLDPFPREGKYGHGYCVDVLPPIREFGEPKPAIAVILTNFSPAKGGKPALLMHREVTTLLHELGHCLHVLLGSAEMPSLSGYQVKKDFLELPSQLLEELLYEPKTLNKLGEHYETHQPISAELIEAKVASRHAFTGINTLRNIERARFSLELYRAGSADADALRAKAYEEILPWFEGSSIRSEASFRHVADPLYMSKYYAYPWSEIFAVDVYDHIKTRNDAGQNGWMEYRQAILEPAGGIDPNELLVNFLGRDPSTEAFQRTLKSTQSERDQM